MTSYTEFLAEKRLLAPATGIHTDGTQTHPSLFPFQRDLVTWSLRKGRAAIFADTGLGKTRMQLDWARLTGEQTLILAPLSVARQTVREARSLDIEARYARHQRDASHLTVTNYEMVEHFDIDQFGAIVLDESSILKAVEGVTRNRLCDLFQETPFRLCCTATPAPNDIGEITNHSEFLGVMPRREVLATFFLHSDEGWRLKNHARAPFFQWLASWGMSLKHPSDLGYETDGYALPPLDVQAELVDVDVQVTNRLFVDRLRGITERAEVRRQTQPARVARAAELLTLDESSALAWVGLNEEGRELAQALGDRALLVEGADTPERKAEALELFCDEPGLILVTKPTIAGFGMNFQHCHRQVFVGINDSYEQYYQAIRRSWRYGQTSPVTVRVVIAEAERAIYENVLRKEAEAETMARELVQHVAEFERAEISTTTVAGFNYEAHEETGNGWRLLQGDSAERLAELPAHSVDLAVFSPPFQALYVYSPTERDLGNCRTPKQFFKHLGYVTEELRRVMRPGRNVCVHCAQITAQKALDGRIGLKDFRGALIDHYEQAGFVYHGEVVIDKDPQAQAIRTHAKGLLFVQKERDSAWLRPALADFILVFRAPGDNAVPVKPDVSNEEWIQWARPIWYGLRETDTLQAPPKANDERHVAPLQLGTIERCVRLWSNPGETVLSPFAGIGSEGYEAIRLGRRFIGVELKPEYFTAAVRNLRDAEEASGALSLFDAAEACA